MSDDWRSHALCRRFPPELFHPVGTKGPARDQAEAAKNICAGCPVARECIEFALTLSEPSGIWGGRWFDVGEHRSYGRSAAVAS